MRKYTIIILAALVVALGAYVAWYAYHRHEVIVQLDKCDYALTHPEASPKMRAPDGTFVSVMTPCLMQPVPPSIGDLVRGRMTFARVPESTKVNPYSFIDVLLGRYTLGPNLGAPCNQSATTTDCSTLPLLAPPASGTSVTLVGDSTFPYLENASVINGWNYYRVSDGVVYYQNKEIANADPATFQELEDGWARDRNAVYEEGYKKAFLNPATVRVLPPIYIMDKAAVWVYGTGYYLRVDKTDADPATFMVISHGYGKDKNNVYYFAQKIANADVQSFTPLRDAAYPSAEGSASSWYAKDIHSAYYRSTVIQNADVQSLVFLGGEYAKDSHTVYYEGNRIANADAGTFALVGQYAKDKNHVFYSGKMLDLEIDPASFAVVGGVAIKDSTRVYFQNYYGNTYDLATGVDASTFQYVGICASVEKSSGSYFKDKNHVFIQNFSGGNPINPVDQIDTPSFKYLGDYNVATGMPYSVSYAKDKNAVYHSCGEPLAGADVSTFMDLKDGYAKDKSAVWYLAQVIAGADAATFQSNGKGYAKDKNHVYFAGNIVD
jgi:hypothetical protein